MGKQLLADQSAQLLALANSAVTAQSSRAEKRQQHHLELQHAREHKQGKRRHTTGAEDERADDVDGQLELAKSNKRQRNAAAELVRRSLSLCHSQLVLKFSPRRCTGGGQACGLAQQQQKTQAAESRCCSRCARYVSAQSLLYQVRHGISEQHSRTDEVATPSKPNNTEQASSTTSNSAAAPPQHERATRAATASKKKRVAFADV